MEESVQKTSGESGGCRPKSKTESEGYGGVHTFMGIVDGKLVEVYVDSSNLLEYILRLDNLNRVYRQVVRNNGVGSVDKIVMSELLPYLKLHKDELLKQLIDGKYPPLPVFRAEIPKDNGKTRPLGIPTVVDRFVQQAVSQV